MAASGGVGALVVTLGLDAASFTEGLTRAQQQAKNFADSIKAIAVGEALGEAIASGAEKAYDALKELTFGALEAADQLNVLSKNAGVSIDALGGIAFAASKTGGSLEDTAASLGKLNKSIAEAAADSSSKASEAFKAIGVSVTDAAGRTKSADQIFADVADKFAGYADGPEKAAIALALFGKAGAAQIALLDQGGQALRDNIAYYQRYSGVTQETSDKASEFNDTLTNVSLINKSFGQFIIAELMPTMQILANAYLHAKENSDLFKDAASGLRVVLETLVVTGATVKDTFVGVGDTLGAYAAVADRLAHGDIAGAKAIGQAYRDAGEQRRRELEAFSNSVIQAPDLVTGDSVPTKDFSFNKPPAAPKLSNTSKASDALKAQLDAQVKLVQDFAKNQQSALAFANSLADVEFQKGNESQQEYFDQQAYLRRQALQVQLTEIDAEIALNQKQADNAKATLAQRTEAAGKVKLLSQQRSEAEQAAANAEAIALEKADLAAKRLADSYANLRAAVIAGSGDEAGAAQLKIAEQFAAAMETITGVKGNPQVAIDQQRQAEFLVELRLLQTQYSDSVDANANKQAQAALDAEAAGKSQLEILVAQHQANLVAIDDLQKKAQAAKELADADPSNAAAQKYAATLVLAVKQAQSAIDPLAKAINTSLEDSFSNSFVGFIEGTKSASQAFRDFTKSIEANLADLASKELAKQIFGTGAGGVGGFFSSFFNRDPTGAGDSVGGVTGSAPDVSNVSFTPNALGLDYVPYDGYKASLHQGERVQTAREAAASKNGGSVYITNNAPVQATAARDSNGDWQILIDTAAKRGAQMTSNDLASGTGPSAQAVRGRFGLGPGNLAKRG